MLRSSWTVIPLFALFLPGCAPSPPASDAPAEGAQSAQSGEAAQSSSETAEAGMVEAEVVEEPALPTAGEVAEQFADLSPSEWGLEIPGVGTLMDSGGIALTLDACGGPNGDGYDAALINGLIERGVPATLFLNMRWVDANPEFAAELAANPLFEIGNHGATHRPLTVAGQAAYGIEGTASPLEAAREVLDNHLRILELTGRAPRFFRSGTAHYDDVGIQVAQAAGEDVLGFSVNADAGATYDAATVRAEVAGAQPGAIIIAHMNQPGGETAEGLLAGVDDLLAQGAQFTLVENPR